RRPRRPPPLPYTTLFRSQETAFARDLARMAGERGIPMVFLSSQASSPQAPTGYGRTKAAIEAAILPLHAAVIRPGLVYGGEERGDRKSTRLHSSHVKSSY